MKDSDIKSKFEHVEDDSWDYCPCRHDLDSMIVTEVDGEKYILEELDSRKYGGFNFNITALKVLLSKLLRWEKRIGKTCYVLGKCGECY